MSLLTLDIFNKKDPYFLKKIKLFEKIFLQTVGFRDLKLFQESICQLLAWKI